MAVFRIGDHQIDQAKAGTARVHTLEGGDRVIEPSRQAIGIAEDAEIHRRVVGIERERLFAECHSFFGVSGRAEHKARAVEDIGRTGRKLDRFARLGRSLLVVILPNRKKAQRDVGVGDVRIDGERALDVSARFADCRFAIVPPAEAGIERYAGSRAWH